jgi:isopenicillin-N epimerase
MTFLNHGSYGATPIEVQEDAARWRARMEAQPVRFFNDELPAALRHAAGVLAGFVGCAPERLGFVENASAGTNAVLAAAPLRPGDEVLTTAHVYNAVRNNLRHVAARTGAIIVEAPVPFPVPDEDAVVNAIAGAIGPRTRLLVVDHIASASAVVFPIARIVALARAQGVPVAVDGAHGPGQVDLDVDAIGADWYVGNVHKWLCAPKGAGFIAASPAPAFPVHPTVISHSYGLGFADEFDKIGTRDCAPWLAVPAAIAFHDRLGGPVLRARNTSLAQQVAVQLADALGTEPGAPASMTAAMATARLPWTGTPDWAAARAIRAALWRRARIELHVTALAGALWARASVAAYNEAADYAALPEALRGAMADLG